jgi:hypothetical protein
LGTLSAKAGRTPAPKSRIWPRRTPGAAHRRCPATRAPSVPWPARHRRSRSRWHRSCSGRPPRHDVEGGGDAAGAPADRSTRARARSARPTPRRPANLPARPGRDSRQRFRPGCSGRPSRCRERNLGRPRSHPSRRKRIASAAACAPRRDSRARRSCLESGSSRAALPHRASRAVRHAREAHELARSRVPQHQRAFRYARDSCATGHDRAELANDGAAASASQ